MRLLGLSFLVCVDLLVIAAAAMAVVPPPLAITVGISSVFAAIAWYQMPKLLDEIREIVRARSQAQAVRWRGRLAKAPLSVMGVLTLPADRARYPMFGQYVERQTDDELREMIRGHRFVVVRGPSLAGKSRSALEAARGVLPQADVVVPDPDLDLSLAQLSTLSSRRETVIWLDDLNRFLRPTGAGVKCGLTVQSIDESLTDKKRLRIVATIRDDAWHGIERLAYESKVVADDDPFADSGANRLPWEILQKARRVDMAGPITDAERGRAMGVFLEPMPAGSSIGEYLVGIPVLLDLLEHATPSERCLVWAAADWQRMWAGDTLTKDGLRTLWTAWMSAEGLAASDELFGRALAFVVRPLSDSVFGFVEEVTRGAYAIGDYWVARRVIEHGARVSDIPAAVWRAAVDLSDTEGMVRMGYRAAIEPSPGIALGAWERAFTSSGDNATKAEAVFNLLMGYRALGLVDMAIESGERLWALSGEADEGQLPLTISRGVFNLAVLYARKGDQTKAKETVEHLQRMLGGSPSALAREAIVRGLLMLQFYQSEAGDLAAAIATGQRIWNSYNNEELPDTILALARSAGILARDQRAKGDIAGAIHSGELLTKRLETSKDPAVMAAVDDALFRLAIDFEAVGDIEGVIRANRQLWSRYSDVDDPPTVLATALHNLSIALESAEDRDAAIEAREALVAKFQTSTEPTIRRLVATALAGMAELQHKQGLFESAIRYGERLWTEFKVSSDATTRRIVASGLVTLGESYEAVGDLQSAVASGERLLASYENDADEETRVAVIFGLVNNAVHLAKDGQTARAIDIEEGLWRRYGRDDRPEIRHLVAAALRNEALHRRLEGDLRGAVEVGQRLWNAFRNSRDDRVRQSVLVGLANLADDYASLGEGSKAVQVGKRLWAEPFLAQTAFWPALFRGLLALADRLAEMGNLDEAVELAERSVARFEAEEKPVAAQAVEFSLARSLGRLLIWYSRLGNVTAAIVAGRRLESEFASSDDQYVRIEVAHGMADMAEILSRTDRISAIDVAERLWSRYGADEDLAVRESVGRIMVGLVAWYGKVGDEQNAALALQRLEAVASKANDYPSKRLLGYGLVNMAAVYEDAGDLSKALEIGQQLSDYRAAEDAALCDRVAQVDAAMKQWKETLSHGT